MFFGAPFGSQKTPIATSREQQEKVIRQSVKERSRSRCGSAQPTRSSSSSQIFGGLSNIRDGHSSFGRAPSAGRPVTQKVQAPRSQDNRVSTPELKDLVSPPNELLIHNADAAAKHLNGPVSPSRTRVKRTLAEAVNELGRSRSVSPTNDQPLTLPIDPLSSTNDRTRSSTAFTGTSELAAYARPSSASPAVFHTVGPREFARLKVKMRSQSPWALHVEDDQLTHQAQLLAHQLEKRAKQALWVDSLAQAVETRKQSAHEARAVALATEMDTLARAKCLTELLAYEKKKKSEEKLEDQRLEYAAIQSRRKMDEVTNKSLRILSTLEHTGFMRDQESSKSAEDAVKREKMDARRKEIAAAAARRQVLLERDNDPLEDTSRAQYLSQLEQRRRQYDSKVRSSRDLVEQRAAMVVTKIGPSRKQQTLDRLDEDFEATAQHLLADNINRVEATQQAARLRNHNASQERLKTAGQRIADQRAERELRLMNEALELARDRESKSIYDQARAQLKFKQTNEVREQLELQRRVSMKRALDAAAAEV